MADKTVSICGANTEVVPTYKYLGVYLVNKLDWSLYTDLQACTVTGKRLDSLEDSLWWRNAHWKR